MRVFSRKINNFAWSALLAVVLLIAGCADKGHILYMDEAYVKKAQSRPTEFAEFRCPKENVVGRWYDTQSKQSSHQYGCIWNFKNDGAIAVEGSGCRRDIPERFEVKRTYDEMLNAYLDIQLIYDGGNKRIIADCVTDGNVMKLNEGGWTFYKVPGTKP